MIYLHRLTRDCSLCHSYMSDAKSGAKYCIDSVEAYIISHHNVIFSEIGQRW